MGSLNLYGIYTIQGSGINTALLSLKPHYRALLSLSFLKVRKAKIREVE